MCLNWRVLWTMESGFESLPPSQAGSRSRGRRKASTPEFCEGAAVYLFFCGSCGKRISDRIGVCPFCGSIRPQGARPDHSGAAETRTTPRPRPIWNPNAACSWSLLFSPAFGAYSQSLNWTTLTEPVRARSAKVWFLVSLLVTTMLSLLPLVGMGQQAARCLALLYLLIWYLAAGRPQTRYVKERYGRDYPRKAWDKPLLIGIAMFLVYVVTASVVVMTVVAVGGLVGRG